MKQNYKITLAYDGTHYYGWQKNQNGPSIEEELERALTQIVQHPTSIQAASRTDRGVHAEGQVVNFFSGNTRFSTSSLHHSLNKILPKDISISSVEKVSSDFHPTLDAICKEYHYTLCNQKTQPPFQRHFSWHVHRDLSILAMQQAADLLIGKRDFSSLSNARVPMHESTLCHLQALDIEHPADNQLLFSLIGDRFLYKMARNLVGTLVYVGLGKLDLSHIPKLFEHNDRKLAGITAPGHGLRLKRVLYSHSKNY